MIKISNSQQAKILLGVNIFKHMSIQSPERIGVLIADETDNIRKTHMMSLPPGYLNSRKLYRSFGIDPTRYRPSSEALWRRVKKGEALPEVNPFVDLTNFLSLKFQIPYGLYDMDKIGGDIELTTGSEDMWYEGIRKDKVSLHEKIILTDGAGPFGNPSSDSLRASTTGSSQNILQVLFFSAVEDQCDFILNFSRELYQQFFEISEVISYIV